MKKELSVLKLPIDATNEQVEKALLKICTKNKKLTKFIKKFFEKNQDIEICAWDDIGYKWDIECEEKIEVAIFNQHFDDWFMYDTPKEFLNYFTDWEWNKITLDNGKYLLLVDEDEYFSFFIVNPKKMKDGYITFRSIKNH